MLEEVIQSYLLPPVKYQRHLKRLYQSHYREHQRVSLTRKHSPLHLLEDLELARPRIQFSPVVLQPGAHSQIRLLPPQFLLQVTEHA
jgi:hypothetical protein